MIGLGHILSEYQVIDLFKILSQYPQFHFDIPSLNDVHYYLWKRTNKITLLTFNFIDDSWNLKLIRANDGTYPLVICCNQWKLSKLRYFGELEQTPEYELYSAIITQLLDNYQEPQLISW